MKYLKENIEEVESKNINKINGIAFKAYKTGNLGGFRDDIETVSVYENMLRQWNFDRDKGDTLVVCVKLNTNK